jgi:hypothetical protein
MFKFIVLLASLVGSSAFAPASQTASSSALKMAFKNSIGAQAPLGFFDPLGLLKNADQDRFDRLRYVETKHGRIAMMAVLGHIVTTAGVRFPGDLAPGLPYAGLKTGLAAFDSMGAGPTFNIIVFIGLMEVGFDTIKDKLEASCTENNPSFVTDRRKAVELNNGRAAQMGILGLMVHEKLDGNPYIINAILGSPVTFN